MFGARRKSAKVVVTVMLTKRGWRHPLQLIVPGSIKYL
ncbi:hypothetical protein C621_0218280 [Bacillus thuringiensis serovar aizawai str. Leapi01]|nr:hypothetical protein C621_0218280 [Bacillus thuringiensis serovar aizawai str. Leapi01]ETE99405.1 hypothetical protein C623_0204350 [Bacillus thuringiensis serovar aizawai str. Hu4-2]